MLLGTLGPCLLRVLLADKGVVRPGHGNGLPGKKDGTSMINIQKYKVIRTPWIALNVNGNNATFFDSSVDEYIPDKTEKFRDNKDIVVSNHGIQAYDSIMCGYFCIGFMDFVLNDLFFSKEFSQKC